MPKFSCLFILLLSVVALCDATLSKQDRKKKPKKPVKDKNPHGFLKLDEYEKMQMLQRRQVVSFRKKNFPNPTLGFVTPWNGKGYDIAKFAAIKFTHISPVWFQVYPAVTEKRKTCIIKGTHDIDRRWLEDVRSNNTEIVFVPRFILERFSSFDYLSFFKNENWQLNCVERIINFVRANEFNGAVLEFWSQIMSQMIPPFREMVVEFVVATSGLFHQHQLQFILTIPAELDSDSQAIGFTTPDEFHKLSEACDFVYVMTYDFKSDVLRGVSPLYWIKNNLLYLLQESPDGASKVLMGINFYGYQWKSKRFLPQSARSFTELLEERDTGVYWDPLTDEHLAHSKSRNEMMFFPTLDSLGKRLDLAKTLKVGIGIWELGQGYDYFTKVL